MLAYKAVCKINREALAPDYKVITDPRQNYTMTGGFIAKHLTIPAFPQPP
jgi:hypothetical protein